MRQKEEIMKKMYEEEDDLKELLELEMIREAQILEETLLSEGDLDNLNLSDDDIDASFAELQQRLKEEGVYRSDEEMAKHAEEGEDTSEKEIISPPPEHGKEDCPEPEKENQPDPVKVAPKRFSLGKAAGFVLIVLLSVFAGSMTSEANRQYLVKQIRYLRGDNSQVVVNNDEDADNSNRDEEEAIEEIERILSVKVPDIYYRPNSMKFSSYFIDKSGGYAYIRYQQIDNIFSYLTIYNRTENKFSMNTSNHGKKTIELPNQGIEIYIRETSNENEESEFDATWEYQNAIYSFRGKVDWEEFKKIVMSMQYDS